MVPAPAQGSLCSPRSRNHLSATAARSSVAKGRQDPQVKEVLKLVLGMNRTTGAQGHQHPALSLPDAGVGQAYPYPLVLPEKDLGHPHQKHAWSNSMLAPPRSPAEPRVH